MAIQDLELKVAASGPAGSAAASSIGTTSITGRVLAVYVEYAGDQGADPAATTDVIVNGEGPPDVPILTVSNYSTSGWFYPRAKAHDADANVMTYDGAFPVPADIYLVSNTIKVTVDDANNGDEVTVTIRYET